MKAEFIRFLKDTHAFDEYKKEIYPYTFDELTTQLEDGGGCFLLQDGCMFFYKNAVTGINWKELCKRWEEVCGGVG